MNHISGSIKGFNRKLEFILKKIEPYVLKTLRFLSKIQLIFYSLVFHCICQNYIKTESCTILSLIFFFVTVLAAVFDYFSIKIFKEAFIRLSYLLLALCTFILAIYTCISLSYCGNNINGLCRFSKYYITKNNGILSIFFNFCKLVLIPVSGLVCIYTKINDYIKKPAYDSIPIINVIDGTKLNIKLSDEGLNIPFMSILFILLNGLTTKNKISTTVMLIDVLVRFTRFTDHKKYTFLLPMIFSNFVTGLTIITSFFDALKLKWLKIPRLILSGC